MTKTNLYIVRHAETLGNIEKRLTGKQDYEITEYGKETIKKLTKRLSNIKFDKAYSSTSGRTLKTIKPLAELNRIEVIQLDDLSEMYFGKYDGWKWEDVDKIQPEVRQNQFRINEIYGIPEQETMENVAERMYNCIIKICEENLGKNILICSSGVAIEAFLRKINGIAFTFERERYCQHNGALNQLIYTNGVFEINVLSDISYLKEKEEIENG